MCPDAAVLAVKLDILKEWLKIASRSDSLEKFEHQIAVKEGGKGSVQDAGEFLFSEGVG